MIFKYKKIIKNYKKKKVNIVLEICFFSGMKRIQVVDNSLDTMRKLKEYVYG